jgi:carboxyl-terminal processing protease
MRGKPGTQIVLTIARKEVDAPFTVQLTREEIVVKSVISKVVEPHFGYIRIRQFQERTGEDLAKAIKDLYKQGDLQGLVLDVRTDPGGLLPTAVGVSAAFLPKDALVVYTDGRTADARMRLSASKENYLRSRGDDYLRDLPSGIKTVPMVVLVDGGTASASEIVAGALQDHKRAVIMGTQTFGKGSVQTILPLGHNTGLKLTTARYYTPNGRSIQAKGIEPDVVVDDGRDLPTRLREANLEHHLEVPAPGAPADSNPNSRAKSAAAQTSAGMEGKSAAAKGTSDPTRRLEFGAAEDFQLQQALNQLKGLPVMGSNKAVAQAKPQ